MIFQAFAILMLAVLFLHAFGQRRRSAPLSYAIMLGAVSGTVLVLFPDLSTRLAHAVGIGRGADLVFYVFMLIIFAAVANLHLRMRASAEVTTILARELALLNAKRPAPKTDLD
jgi:hypothetical protein